MLKISKEADYALRIVYLLALYNDQRCVDANMLSKSIAVLPGFVKKIAHALNKAGIIKSFRGVKGGYALNKAMENITLRQVIETIDGEITLNPCLRNGSLCSMNASETCAVHQYLQAIRTSLINQLDSVNFAMIAKGRGANGPGSLESEGYGFTFGTPVFGSNFSETAGAA